MSLKEYSTLSVSSDSVLSSIQNTPFLRMGGVLPLGREYILHILIIADRAQEALLVIHSQIVLKYKFQIQKTELLTYVFLLDIYMIQLYIQNIKSQWKLSKKKAWNQNVICQDIFIWLEKIHLEMKCFQKFKPIFTRVSQKFGNILLHASLRHVYHMTKVVQAVVGTCCVWLCWGSWCAVMLCIALLRVWFESCTNEHAM